MKRWLTRAVGLVVCASVGSSVVQAQNYPYYPPPMQPAPTAPYYPGAPMPGMYPGSMPGYPGMPMMAVRPGGGPVPGVPMMVQAPGAGQPAPSEPLPPAEAVDMSTPATMDFAPESAGNGNGTTGGWRSGAGVYFVKPFYEQNPAFVLTRSVTNNNLNIANTEIVALTDDFDYRLSGSPRVWLAYVGDSGMGARFRYWRFDQSASSKDFVNGVIGAAPVYNVASPIALGIASSTNAGFVAPALSTGSVLLGIGPVGADQYEFNSGMQLDVWDFEGLREFVAGRWLFQIAAGIRYAHIGQDYQLDRFNSGTVGAQVFNLELETMRAGQSFQGFGPVLAFNARRQLSDSGFSLVGDVRGATLIGRGTQKVSDITQVQGAVAGVPFDEFRPLSAVYTHNDTMPIVEVEFGTQWRSESEPEGASLFAEAALVGQTWFGAGTGTTNAGNLSFFGLSFVAGMQY